MTQDNIQQQATHQAISKLLDQAPEVPFSPHLRDDIIAVALLDLAPDIPASPGLKHSILNKVTIDSSQPASDEIINFSPKPRHNPPRRWLSGNAFGAGLMAASLVLGIWTGTSNFADPLIAAPLELAGMQLPETDDSINYYNVIDGLTPSESAL